MINVNSHKGMRQTLQECFIERLLIQQGENPCKLWIWAEGWNKPL